VIITLRIGNTARLTKHSNKDLTSGGRNTVRVPAHAHQLNLTILGYPLVVVLGPYHVLLHINVVVEDLTSYCTAGRLAIEMLRAG